MSFFMPVTIIRKSASGTLEAIARKAPVVPKKCPRPFSKMCVQGQFEMSWEKENPERGRRKRT